MAKGDAGAPSKEEKRPSTADAAAKRRDEKKERKSSKEGEAKRAVDDKAGAAESKDEDKAKRREERARRRELKALAAGATAGPGTLASRSFGGDENITASAIAQALSSAGVRSTLLGVGAAVAPQEPVATDGAASVDLGYSKQLTTVQGLMNGPVALVRKRVLSVIEALETNAGRIRAARATIERDTRNDADGIIERLRAAERAKLAVLQSEMARAAVVLAQVQDLTADVARAGAPQDPAERRALAAALPVLADRASRVSALHVDDPPTVDHTDLPTETAQRRTRLARSSALERVVAVKDALCWSLLRERGARTAQPAPGPGAGAPSADGPEAPGAVDEARLQEVITLYEEEMAAWSDMAEQQAEALDAARRREEVLQLELAELRRALQAKAPEPTAPLSEAHGDGT